VLILQHFGIWSILSGNWFTIKTLGPIVSDKLPAGHFRSVCNLYFWFHPVTNEFYVQAEPFWWLGACAFHDGNKGQFSYAWRILHSCRNSWRKYGVMVEEYSFHNEGAAMVNFKVAMGSTVLSRWWLFLTELLGYSSNLGV
jgi:hypothetical protein